MKSTKEKIDVMWAHEEGKTIEIRDLNYKSDKWLTVLNTPAWNWHYHDYRVKAEEPKTIIDRGLKIVIIEDNNLDENNSFTVAPNIYKVIIAITEDNDGALINLPTPNTGDFILVQSKSAACVLINALGSSNGMKWGEEGTRHTSGHFLGPRQSTLKFVATDENTYTMIQPSSEYELIYELQHQVSALQEIVDNYRGA